MSRSLLIRAVWLGCLVTTGVACAGSDEAWTPSDAGAPESAPLAMARHYALETVLDLSPVLSDDAGLTSWLVDLGDGPFDPATWLLDWANQAAPTTGPLGTIAFKHPPACVGPPNRAPPGFELRERRATPREPRSSTSR